jgi:hypothetical protein
MTVYVSGTRAGRLEEMLEMRGPEIYLYYPNGIGRSKLTSGVIETICGLPGPREIDSQAT